MTLRHSDRTPPRRLRGAALLALGAAACGFDAKLLDLAPGAEAAAPDASDGTAADAASPPASSPRAPLATGGAQTYHLRDGALFAWGKNANGELATGDTDRRLSPTPIGERVWSQVAAGDAFGCALEEPSGAVWCWGDNSRGQLGTGDRTDRHVPFNVALALPATRIATGSAFACALLRDGSLWCWGDGRDGELGPAGVDGGLATAPARIGLDADWTRVSGGGGHACGLRGTGLLFCWGRAASGQLGTGLPAPTRSDAVLRVGGEIDWVDVACGNDSTCAIRGDGSLWCWGSNTSGQVGDPGSSPAAYVPTRIGLDWRWAGIAVGAASACAIDVSQRLFCWGSNAWGLLGLGDTSRRSSPTAVPSSTSWIGVEVGGLHACALDADGGLWCAGANGDGALGLGDTRNRSLFTALP